MTSDSALAGCELVPALQCAGSYRHELSNVEVPLSEDAASRYGSLVQSTTCPVDNSGDKLGETPQNVCTQPVENCGNVVNYTD